MNNIIIAITIIVCISLIISIYVMKTNKSIGLAYQEAAAAQKPVAQKQQPAQKQPAQKQPAPTRKPVQPAPTRKPVQLAPTRKPVQPPTRKPVQPPTKKPVQPPTKKPVQPVPSKNDLNEIKKYIQQQMKELGGKVPSNNKIDSIAKQIDKLTSKLNLNQKQTQEMSKDVSNIENLLQSGKKGIKVNGSVKDVLKDLKKYASNNKNIDTNGLVNQLSKYLKNKGGDLSTSEYNKLLNSMINIGTTSQTYRLPVDPKYKTKDDIRYDFNSILKQNGIPVSSTAGSALRKYLSNFISKYDVNAMPSNVYTNLVDKYGASLSKIVDKLDDRMGKAVKTLNAKNSSGVLPSNSNYKDLVSSGLVYFNKNTGAWTTTQKGKALQKELTVNNMPLTSNKIYNDVQNFLKTDGSVSKLENRINQAVKTLNAKNSSGKLPSDSTYKDLVHNGLVYFNKNTGAWTTTQKGKNVANYLSNNLSNNAYQTLENLYGNLSSQNYNSFMTNLLNGQLIGNQYALPANKTASQISRDVNNTISKYYNAPTNSINPVVTDMLTQYISQRDLTKLDQSEYNNLLNGVVKGYGLGNGTLSPTGQGISGRMTVDNKQVPIEKLQADVYNAVQSIYAANPQAADTRNIVNNVLTYLDTKGGNVSSDIYDDFVVGLVRGYGIGNGTLSPTDLQKW